MKYDDASWHYGGDFPADLPQAAGAAHIGMFLAWLIRNDYASQELIEEAEEEIGSLKSEKLSGAQFLLRVLDEKFTNQEPERGRQCLYRGLLPRRGPRQQVCG